MSKFLCIVILTFVFLLNYKIHTTFSKKKKIKIVRLTILQNEMCKAALYFSWGGLNSLL